ncbi:hypothetical protein [Nitrosomonas sp. Nm166]|uniref:hypothetical protein n=1 Tax=Nitrosomonas sp. Nm166 TaxID=1881054 RepID=UPI0008ED4F64|nr:hypothetical protein [Nitrosomonas sp. Nm166]SFF03453.1 hypothetical protein SAMN05428977_10449 [Nitrosomonas sp. Nm166]
MAMSTKKRDYKAEYQRRRQLAQERGLSIAQARGHARISEAKVSELKRSGVIGSTRKNTLERFYQAIKGVSFGKSLSRAAKDARISVTTIKKLDSDRGILRRSMNGNRWDTFNAAHYPILTKDGKLLQDVPLDKKNASIVGQYWNAANKARLGDASSLDPFAHSIIFDMNGNQYRLLTSVDDLISIFEQMSDADLEGYERSFASEQRAFRVMNYGS